MKVALLSFHNGFNYGAALQAYGLQKAIERMNVDCEYIDYVNSYRKNLYDMNYRFISSLKKKDFLSAIRALCGMPFMFSRKKKFQEFYKSNVKKTVKQYSNSSEAKELNDKYDKFIVGSDQVWNYINNGRDWAYLLDFVDDEKRIAYSSSFGLSAIPDEFEKEYRDNLLKFNRIAVREVVGKDIVKKLTGRIAHVVVDPVFLITQSEWMKLFQNQKSVKKPYVFFYVNGRREIEAFRKARYLDKKYVYHILSSRFSPFDCLDKYKEIKISMAPTEFLSEIYCADFVVTDSFHCLAFSIIFKKKFMVLLTGNQGKDERLINLLKLIGLEDRILTSQTCETKIHEPIDYDLVWKRLEPIIEYSKDYLNRAIFALPDIENRKIIENRFICMDNRCTGCNACAEICKSGAIKMVQDSEGFLFPKLDQEKCVECGLCHKVCQIFNDVIHTEFEQEYWAVKNIDEIREKSTSGGVFTAFSDYILRKGGCVVAASMNERFEVTHCIATNEMERDKMRGTYYVQSDLRGIYSKVKKILNAGISVLFVGTPCQVRGLKLFLGGDNENLYTCDIVCHGVPSPRVFKAFIEWIKKKGTVESYYFRDKSFGWRGYTESVILNGKKYHGKIWLQSFNSLFSHNLINRWSCTYCSYSTFNRCSDVTIGDYWGIERTMPEFEDKKGVSLVLCNTQKGKSILDNAVVLEKRKISREEAKQNSLLSPAKASVLRAYALKCFNKYGYKDLAKRYGEYNLKGYLKNTLRKIIR